MTGALETVALEAVETTSTEVVVVQAREVAAIETARSEVAVVASPPAPGSAGGEPFGVVVSRQQVVVVSGGGGSGASSSPQLPAGVEFFVAGEILGGHRVVKANASGQAVYADRSDSGSQHVLGVTLGAAAQGDAVEVRRLGSIEEPSWSWTPNQPIFLGSGGLLTQTYPGGPVSIIVGFALTPTSMFVAPREPIILS